LGVVLYEMLTGQLPFKGQHEPSVMYSILNEEPEPLTKHKSGISNEIQQIVNKVLTKDRNQRYQQVEQLAAELSKLSGTEQRIKTRRFRYHKRIKNKHVIWLSACLLILAITIAAIYLWPSRSKVTPFFMQVTRSGDVDL
jgi:eukaryotic-like serine/threonine-protein kinase